jgi:hypothetical protein
MARRLAAAAALAVLAAGCGGGGTPAASPSAPETQAPTASPTKKKPKPKPSKTATPSPTPSATTPPPPTGEPVGTAEALVSLVQPGEPVRGDQCGQLAPDVATPTCTALKVSGGTLVAVTGRLEGRKAVRLLVQTPEGYVARYEGGDDGRSWGRVRVFATPLTGQGVDGIVVAARLTDGALTYDVITWVPGGPPVLRAHRPPLADGRLAPRDNVLEEYEQARDRSYVKRRLAWDGRRFLISAGVRTTTPPPR